MTAEVAATVAPFTEAVNTFAAGFTVANGAYAGITVPVQQRVYQIGDTSDYVQILAAAGKFKASNLYWITPITQTRDGHAFCEFQIVLLPTT